MHTREHFAKLVDLARTGSVRPRIAARHTLADIHQAQEQFLERRHVGKIVITPGVRSEPLTGPSGARPS